MISEVIDSGICSEYYSTIGALRVSKVYAIAGAINSHLRQGKTGNDVSVLSVKRTSNNGYVGVVKIDQQCHRYRATFHRMLKELHVEEKSTSRVTVA